MPSDIIGLKHSGLFNLRRSPPPSFGQNGQKWQKLTFWYKWAQICIKLMKILNLAQKVGSTGKK